MSQLTNLRQNSLQSLGVGGCGLTQCCYWNDRKHQNQARRAVHVVASELSSWDSARSAWLRTLCTHCQLATNRCHLSNGNLSECWTNASKERLKLSPNIGTR